MFQELLEEADRVLLNLLKPGMNALQINTIEKRRGFIDLIYEKVCTILVMVY